MWGKMLEFFFKAYLTSEAWRMIRALPPGSEAYLPPMSLTDRGIRYEFQVRIWRHNP
jgi:hypothetical protein